LQSKEFYEVRQFLFIFILWAACGCSGATYSQNVEATYDSITTSYKLIENGLRENVINVDEAKVAKIPFDKAKKHNDERNALIIKVREETGDPEAEPTKEQWKSVAHISQWIEDALQAGYEMLVELELQNESG
jgi:hypothetical protein